MIPPLLAIFSFPLVAVILFRKLAPGPALVWTILLGYLFLPTKIRWNLPVLPAIDKDTMPALVGLLCLLILTPGLSRNRAEAQPGWLPRQPIIRLLILSLPVGTFLTVLTNGDALNYGTLKLPGLRPYDGLSAILSTLMLILPLLLARKYLATEDSLKLILRALCIAGLIYSLPIIFELLMSPQLNRIVYGFFPHSWKQHIRGDGYRPLVFLKHGLWLGIFMCVSVLATAGYARVGPAQRRPTYLAAGAWLLVILMACKSLGAFAIALALIPVVLFLNVRNQLLVAAVLSGVILLYPALRGAGLIPVQEVVSFAESIDTARARSFQYRLNNEDILLAKANQRRYFGWGTWGRPRVYDEYGRDVSTTDGLWVIVIGERGWLGYIGLFGLLCIPTLLMAVRRKDQNVTPTTAVFTLAVTANLIDLIPNAGLTPVTWMMVGALIGRLELRPAEVAATEATEVAAVGDRMPLTRFPTRHQKSWEGPRRPSPARTAQPHRTRFTGPTGHHEDPNAH